MADEFTLVNTHRYTSTIFLCLLFSFLFCFSFLPPLVSLSGKKEFHGQGSHVGLLVGVAIMSVLMLLFICRKASFHRKQSVFWPKRCRHCARVVGSLYAKIETGHKKKTLSPAGTQAGTTEPLASFEKQPTSGANTKDETPHTPDDAVLSNRTQCQSAHQCRTRHNRRDRPTTSMASYPNQSRSQLLTPSANQTSIQEPDLTITDPGTSDNTQENLPRVSSKSRRKQNMPDDAASLLCDSDVIVKEELNKSHEDQANPIDNSEANFYFPKHYNSLVSSFMVFGTIGVILNLLNVAGLAVCLTIRELSRAAFLEELLRLSVVTLIPLSLKLITTYRGAILVGTITNCYAVAFVFGACIWFSALGIILPVSQEFLGDSVIATLSACHINGTFGKILDYVGM